MVPLPFRSGESFSLRRDHTLPILQRNNSTIMQRVCELSPGAIVRGKGIVILMEFGDDEPQILARRNTASLAANGVGLR